MLNVCIYYVKTIYIQTSFFLEREKMYKKVHHIYVAPYAKGDNVSNCFQSLAAHIAAQRIAFVLSPGSKRAETPKTVIDVEKLAAAYGIDPSDEDAMKALKAEYKITEEEKKPVQLPETKDGEVNMFLGFEAIGTKIKQPSVHDKGEQVAFTPEAHKISNTRVAQDALILKPFEDHFVYQICMPNIMVCKKLEKAVHSIKVDDKSKTDCQSVDYRRWPGPDGNYGHPLKTPPWLKPGQGCSNCQYAPHVKGGCTWEVTYPVLVLGQTTTYGPGIYGPLIWVVRGQLLSKILTTIRAAEGGSVLRLGKWGTEKISQDQTPRVFVDQTKKGEVFVDDITLLPVYNMCKKYHDGISCKTPQEKGTDFEYGANIEEPTPEAGEGI